MENRPALDSALKTRVGTALRVCLTFLGVCCTWILFRSPTLARAGVMFQGMFAFKKLGLSEPLNLVSIGILIGVVVLGHWHGRDGRWRAWLEKIPATAVGVLMGIAMTIAIILTPDSGKVFIYFQF